MKKVFPIKALYVLLFVLSNFVAFSQRSPDNVGFQLYAGSTSTGKVFWSYDNTLPDDFLIDNFTVEESVNGGPFTAKGTVGVGTTNGNNHSWKLDVSGLVVGNNYTYRITTNENSGTPTPGLVITTGPHAIVNIKTPSLSSNGNNTNSTVTLIYTDENANDDDKSVLEYGTDGVNFPNSIDLPNLYNGVYIVTGLNANTNYFFRAVAIKGGTRKLSPPVNEKTKRNLPPVPVMSPGKICPDGVTLNYNLIDNNQFNDAYLQTSLDGSSFDQGVIINAGNARFVQTTPGKVTYYRIASVNETGTVYSDTYVHIAPNFTPPTAPGGLMIDASKTTENSLSLIWSNAQDQDLVCNDKVRETIHVYASINDGPEQLLEAIHPDQYIYTLNGLMPKTKVTFRVQSVNYTYGGPFGITLPVTGLTYGPPFAPGINSVETIKDGLGDVQNNIYWADNSDDEDGFIIMLSKDGGITYTDYSYVLPNNYGAVHKPIEEGVNYTYKIRAFNKYGETFSEPFNYKVPFSVAPSAPVGLKAVASASTISLSWLDVATNENNYVVLRSTDGIAFDSIASVGMNVTTFVDNAVENGKTYIYKVKAVNEKGSSTSVKEASATVGVSGKLLNTDNTVGVFPNPTVDFLNLTVPSKYRGTDGEVMLVDQNNRVVLQKKVKFDSENFLLDIKRFKEGSYSVIIITEDYKLSKKIYKY